MGSVGTKAPAWVFSYAEGVAFGCVFGQESPAMTQLIDKQILQSDLHELFGRYALPGTTVSNDAHITGDLGIDSLGVMEIVAELEDKYALSFPDDELPRIRTVGDVVGAITRSLEGNGRAS
jgi:acyl carrier protein